MQPILVQWGDFILPAWHCFFVLGALASYALLTHLAQRFYPHLYSRQLTTLYLGGYVGAYLGARGLSIFLDQPQITQWSERLTQLFSFGPMTFYGGFLGAALSGILYVSWAKLPWRELVDLAMPAGFLGLAVGRLGCFLNGDDYGKVVALEAGEAAPWWALAFPFDDPGVYRVPVQLLESAGAVLLVLLVYLLFGRIRERLGASGPGLLCLLGYCLLRFGDEFLRGDPRGPMLAGIFSPSQVLSLLLWMGGLALLACRPADKSALKGWPGL